jgi:hypothetical protein
LAQGIAEEKSGDQPAGFRGWDQIAFIDAGCASHMKKAHSLQGRILCGVPVDEPELVHQDHVHQNQGGHHCTSSSISLASGRIQSRIGRP